MSNNNEDFPTKVRALAEKARAEYLKNGHLNIEFHTRTDIVIRRSKY